MIGYPLSAGCRIGMLTCDFKLTFLHSPLHPTNVSISVGGGCRSRSVLARLVVKASLLSFVSPVILQYVSMLTGWRSRSEASNAASLTHASQSSENRCRLPQTFARSYIHSHVPLSTCPVFNLANEFAEVSSKLRGAISHLNTIEYISDPSCGRSVTYT